MISWSSILEWFQFALRSYSWCLCQHQIESITTKSLLSILKYHLTKKLARKLVKIELFISFPIVWLSIEFIWQVLESPIQGTSHKETILYTTYKISWYYTTIKYYYKQKSAGKVKKEKYEIKSNSLPSN